MISNRTIKRGLIIWLFAVAALSGNSQELNTTQVTGSHNSYKKAMDSLLMQYLATVDSQSALTLEYSHAPLTEQLELGLRALEFDVFYDPNGAHYHNPAGLEVVRAQGGSPAPYDNEALLTAGFKLMHIQDLDFRTHHILFVDALRELEQWSAKNPNHHPVFITMNTNDAKLQSPLRDPLPFTAIAYDSLDMEIRSVLGKRLITPDSVRHKGLTLEQSILEHGWGELSKYRGRFIFILDANYDSEQHDIYLSSSPNLCNKVFFTNSKEGTPSAAIRIVNDPVEDFDYIRSLVARGYIVRTRADADTWEARSNDTKRQQSAIASGAQIISTDYYYESEFFDSDYTCPVLKVQE